jgi:hypothetical protein
MDDFLYIVHFHTILPVVAAGLLVGVTLFNTFRLTADHYFLLALIQLIFGVTGTITRYLEEEPFERFAGVIFLYYVFLGSAILAQKISKKLKIAPYFTHK